MSQLNIQLGHIARHTPPNAGAQGREAAIVDVAQDLLLRHLHQEGVLDGLAFKGGTSLRKLYAGTAGRFSLDLDFGCAGLPIRIGAAESRRPDPEVAPPNGGARELGCLTRPPEQICQTTSGKSPALPEAAAPGSNPKCNTFLG
jgi:hypothetical protein